MEVSIALIGDYDPSIISHQTIPHSFTLASRSLGMDPKIDWISTQEARSHKYDSYNAIWFTSGLPYCDIDGAIHAIEYARMHFLPFLATGEGYEVALIDFARNILGLKYANCVKRNSQTPFPVLCCDSQNRDEKNGVIHLYPDSYLHRVYQSLTITEKFHQSYTINEEYYPLYCKSHVFFAGKGDNDEPLAFELKGYPFFVGTAFTPESAILKDSENPHPLLVNFLRVIRDHRSEQLINLHLKKKKEGKL